MKLKWMIFNWDFILFCELKINDSVFIETSGLDELSILRLMKFCLLLTDLYNGKFVYIVENIILGGVEADRMIVKPINDYLIDEIRASGLKTFIKSIR